jgi:integrase
MSRSSIPKMTLHKPSGQARVRIKGRDIYLGRSGTPEAEAEYRRVIAEWLATGRAPKPLLRSAHHDDLTVTSLIAAFWRYRSAQQIAEESLIKVDRPVFRRLRRMYGHIPASQFSSSSMRALMAGLAREDLSRQYINKKFLPTVKRLFKWGAREELIPVEVYHHLTLVEGLKRGEYGARETKPVEPVADELVGRTLLLLSSTVADMVRVQRLTGMRPGEVCGMTWAEIDMNKDCWVYRPSHHKNAHRGRIREVAIGPRAQTVMMKYRDRAADAALFSPAEEESLRKIALRGFRKTPMTPSHRVRDAQHAANADMRRRPPGDHYTTPSYARAIESACKRGELPHWTPNQLRHAAATQLRGEAGLEAAWAVLGHDKPDTTLIYAQRRLDLATEQAMRVG